MFSRQSQSHRHAHFPARDQRFHTIGEQYSPATRGADIPEPSLAHALIRMRKACLPGSLAFIVSDYSELDTSAETELRRLSVHAHVTNLLVHDPLDAFLPARGDYRVSDGDHVLSLDQMSTAQHKSHELTFETRKERVAQLSRQRSMAFLAVSTADKPESVLHPHRKHAGRAKSVGRAA